MITHTDLNMTLEDFNFVMALCGLAFAFIVTKAVMKVFF